jgi:hypothetical protein
MVFMKGTAEGTAVTASAKSKKHGRMIGPRKRRRIQEVDKEVIILRWYQVVLILLL